jgi:hypothetical protein
MKVGRDPSISHPLIIQECAAVMNSLRRQPQARRAGENRRSCMAGATLRVGRRGARSDTTDRNGGTLLENIVAEIDAEISRLREAKALLTGISAPAKRAPGRPAKTIHPAAASKKKKRRLSAEAREKMRQAQIKRSAAVKKSATKSNKE